MERYRMKVPFLMHFKNRKPRVDKKKLINIDKIFIRKKNLYKHNLWNEGGNNLFNQQTQML